jgi:hypothetical protein
VYETHKKEIKKLEKNMSRKERNVFRKRQKQAQDELIWNMLMAAEFLDEDILS